MAYIFDYIENLDSLLKIQCNSLRFVIILQFFVYKSRKYYFQHQINAQFISFLEYPKVFLIAFLSIY